MSKIYYSPSHEYIRVEGTSGFVGITEYAQKQLGNVVYVDLPEVDDDVTAGEDFGAIESVIKVSIDDPAELDDLLDEAAYQELCH